MGLDMYLYSVPKIEGMDLEAILNANTRLATLEKDDPDLYQKVKGYIRHFEQFGHRWDSLLTEVAYWRKANQIHRWFVQNVQDGQDNCLPYEVKEPHLVVLRNACELIITGKEEPRDMLPTQPGFFFGNTDYDDYYYLQIRETFDMLDNLLQNFSFEQNTLFYQSSW